MRGGEDRRGDFGAIWQRALDTRIKRRKLLRYTTLGVGTWVASVLVGCGKTQGISRSAVEGTKTPRFGGAIRMQLDGEPDTYDPQASQAVYTQWIYSNVSHRLIKFDIGPDIAPTERKIVPDLAEKWEKPDEATYIFRLHQGVKWHDRPPVNGREFVADDAVFSYQRYIRGKLPMSWLFGDVDRIEAKDKYTVAFYLKEPSTFFLTNLCSNYSWIVSREIVEKEGDLKKHSPVGMGPFIFASHDRGVSVNYKRNPNWFRKPKPYADEVRCLTVKDVNANQAAFLGGELDNYSATGVLDVENMRRNFPAAHYESYLVTNVGNVPILNARRAPFSDKRVRKAISLAINREAIRDTVFPGDGVIQGVIYAATPEFTLPEAELRQLYRYDITESKRLLAEAGFPNGFRTTVMIPTGYGQKTLDVGEMFVASIKGAGIDAEVRMIDNVTYVKVRQEGSMDMTCGPHSTYVDPGQMLEAHYLTGGGRNEAGISDPKLDDMIRRQRRTLDQAERKKIFQDIERYVAQEVNTMPPTAVGKTHVFWSPRLIGHRPHFTYGWRVGDIWTDQ